MQGVGSLKNWQYLFVLEGAFTIAVGLSAYFWVPPWPRQATVSVPQRRSCPLLTLVLQQFLNDREKEILLARLAAGSDSADNEPFSMQGVKQALVDPYVYLYAFLFMGFAFPLCELSG